MKWNVLFVEKNIFGDFFDGSRIWSTACNHYQKCDVIYRYHQIELIWCLLKWSNISKTMLLWNGILVLFVLLAGFPWNMARPQRRLLSLTVKKTLMSSLLFHIAIPQTSNTRRTPSFDLTDEFWKPVYYKTRLILENWQYICLALPVKCPQVNATKPHWWWITIGLPHGVARSQWQWHDLMVWCLTSPCLSWGLIFKDCMYLCLWVLTSDWKWK